MSVFSAYIGSSVAKNGPTLILQIYKSNLHLKWFHDYKSGPGFHFDIFKTGTRFVVLKPSNFEIFCEIIQK